MNDLLVSGAGELPAERNPALTYLASLAPSGRRSMASQLNSIARLATGNRAGLTGFAWHRIRYQHAVALLSLAREMRGPSSLQILRAALRRVLKESWRLGWITAEEYQRAIDLDLPRHYRLPRGRALTAGELRALFEACARDNRPVGRRDAAMLAVLYGCGLRLSELVALDLIHYDPAAGALKILGKGDKERLVFLPAGSVSALAEWLGVRGPEAGPLWYASGRRGRELISRRPGVRSVQRYVCAARARQAGVGGFSPHDLRRSLISDLLEATGDLSLVGSIVGHSDLQTTRKYDRRPETAQRKAAARVHVPFRGAR